MSNHYDDTFTRAYDPTQVEDDLLALRDAYDIDATVRFLDIEEYEIEATVPGISGKLYFYSTYELQEWLAKHVGEGMAA